MNPRKLFDYCDIPHCGRLASSSKGADSWLKCSLTSSRWPSRRRALEAASAGLPPAPPPGPLSSSRASGMRPVRPTCQGATHTSSRVDAEFSRSISGEAIYAACKGSTQFPEGVVRMQKNKLKVSQTARSPFLHLTGERGDTNSRKQLSP